MPDNTPCVAFPSRNIRVLRAGTLPRVFYHLAVALVVVGTLCLFLYQFPGIARDWKINSDPVVVTDATVLDTRCKVRALAIQTCRALLDYRVDGHRYQTSLEFSFASFERDAWPVDVFRSASHPELATLGLALDRIWNRIAVLVFFVGALLLLTMHLVSLSRFAAAVKRMQGTEVRLFTVKVRLGVTKKAWGWTSIPFSYRVKGRNRYFVSLFHGRESPFRLDDEHALAVVSAEGAAPILLDAELARLELSSAEREALYVHLVA